MDNLSRLCWLIEQCNAPARKRNNAYLRNRYIVAQQPIRFKTNEVLLHYSSKSAKMQANFEDYDKQQKLYKEVRKLYAKEIIVIKRQLKLRLQIMCNCPIIQNVYSIDKTFSLNGKQIREKARDYEAEMILLGY